MEDLKKSILEMAHGAFIERADYEMSRIIDNIMDPNTKATDKRKLTITMELAPDDSRSNVSVKFTAKSALASTNPVRTNLYIAGSDSNSDVQVVEMVPQIPGQMNLYGEEQDQPVTLKLVKSC
ncbi:MAG: hypothetical protein LKJ75_02410 [Clostridia bacterium]|jgi:hypothetical protein|nr:hypothetical protein [Clostridia bacterium]MCI2014036.1 hypothetical protein [Clostridia bacterium]